MAQQPRLERQLKSPSSKTLNEERAPFSRSQKGRKGPFPPSSCSGTPAGPALAGDTRCAQMLGSRRRRGASDNAGSVCAGISVLRPPGMQGLEEPLCCPHKGCPGLPAPPVTHPGCPGPAVRGSCSSSSIVLPEQDSSGTVQPLAASPQISSAGASPPGSASPAVGVGSEGLSPPGWCEHHPAHPAVGTGWHRRGREQAPAWGGWSQECLVPVSPVFRQCFGYKKLKGQGRWVVSQLLCRRGDKAGPGGASHSLSQKDPMLGTVHNSPH